MLLLVFLSVIFLFLCESNLELAFKELVSVILHLSQLQRCLSLVYLKTGLPLSSSFFFLCSPRPDLFFIELNVFRLFSCHLVELGLFHDTLIKFDQPIALLQIRVGEWAHAAPCLDYKILAPLH